MEQANISAIPIALVGQYIAATKGDRKIEPDAFNPIGKHLYQQQAKEAIDPVAARIFLELSSQQLIPAWAVGQIDVKLLRAAAK